MFIGSKPKDLFPRQNKAAADFYRRQQQKRIQAQGPYLVQRSFRRNEGTTDYATIPEVTLAGHFVIEFDLLVTSFAGGVKVMDGGTDGGADRLDVNITALGLFDVRDYFKSYVNGVAGASVVLNQLNKIRIVRDASDANQSTRFLDILLARVNNTGNNLPGILANLKIWDNGTLIRDYPLDDNSDILRNRATVLGVELVVNGGFSDESGWSLGDGWSISGGAAYCDGSQAADTILSQAVSAPIGDYLIEIDTGNISAVDVKSIFFGGVKFNSSGITSAGKSRFLGTTINSDNLAIIGNSSFIGSVDNISIRQADGYGTVVNGNADDWGLFQQQTTGEWLGQELVTQQVWESPFSIGSEWTFSNNQWTLNGTGILSPLTLISTDNQPDVLRLTTDVVSISGAALAVTDGAASVLEKTSTGTYSDDIDKATYSRQLYKRNGGAVTAVINKPSIKEVLNVS